MDKITLFLSYFLLILAAGLCQTNSNNPCQNNVFGGKCVDITSCPKAISLLRIGDFSIIAKMSCKGENDKNIKVCCPLQQNSVTFTEAEENTTVNFQAEKTSTPIELTTPVPEMSSSPFPNRDVCGKIITKNRIFNGNITAPNEFPWLVRLKYLIDNHEKYICAGSLITNQFVLTAAHCLTKDFKSLSVRLGEWDEETEIDCMGSYCNHKPVDINVTRIFFYPEFKKQESIRHDIALLQLSEPVTFTDFIQPVCLPTTEYIAMQDYITGKTYWVAGWGYTEYETTSPIKRKVNLEAVPANRCQGNSRRTERLLLPNIICAAGSDGKDACAGDSGGSLVRSATEEYQTNWYLFGITSFGPKCGDVSGRSSVYTRITPYMDWIKRIVVRYVSEFENI